MLNRKRSNNDIRINHNCSTDLKRSVINYWGGLKPVLRARNPRPIHAKSFGEKRKIVILVYTVFFIGLFEQISVYM